MKKIVLALFILFVITSFPAKAKPNKPHPIKKTAQTEASQTEKTANQPTLTCTANGKNITLTVAGNLALLRAGLPLPENGIKLCMVSGGRTAGSAKVAENLGLCQDDKRDQKRKLVFGPMMILGGSFDRFQFFFLLPDGKTYMMHGTHHFRVAGACRHIEDIEGFAFASNGNAEQARRPR